ncbi:MAG: YkgJ family cysteine cluster protein [bacterium]
MIDYKKDQQETDTDSREIANLCQMCGKCCLAIVTAYKHEELIEMSKNDEKEAKIFVDFFKRYDSIADARKVVPDQVNQVLRHKNLSEDLQGDEVQFYYCEKITADNKCTIHKDRPLCCRIAPVDGWTLMPPKCGYTGWQAQEKERIKQNIRSLKEKIYEIETLEGPDAFVEELNISLKEFKEQIEKKTASFARYGAKGW